MKVKTFQIRLSKKHLESDIQFINESIELINVKRIMSELITGEIERWSVLIFYFKTPQGVFIATGNIFPL